MKVILLQDVEDLGKKDEIKKVPDGFARNHLIPKGLVRLADQEALRRLETDKETSAKKAEADLETTQELASSIDGQEISMQVKVGEKDQLFEAITAQKISEKLKEAGFKIKKSQIEPEKPIKELGEFSVKILFEHGLEATIKVIITHDLKPLNK